MPEPLISQERWGHLDVPYNPELPRPLIDFVDTTVRRLDGIYTVEEVNSLQKWEAPSLDLSRTSAEEILRELAPRLDQIGYTSGLSYS
ncbi:MAG: hypothetical protein GYA55_10245, partial [SAR324 cluster bacterium]|nr:hypothetical protein [SAR324 cluster bacterium]